MGTGGVSFSQRPESLLEMLQWAITRFTFHGLAGLLLLEVLCSASWLAVNQPISSAPRLCPVRGFTAPHLEGTPQNPPAGGGKCCWGAGGSACCHHDWLRGSRRLRLDGGQKPKEDVCGFWTKVGWRVKSGQRPCCLQNFCPVFGGWSQLLLETDAPLQ